MNAEDRRAQRLQLLEDDIGRALAESHANGELRSGDISTLWRAPAAMPDKGEVTETPAGAAWLDRQLALAAAGGAGTATTATATAGRPVTAAVRQSRIQRFQLAQGVTPDGRAGPLTLMLLNRMVGVSEPRLRTGA